MNLFFQDLSVFYNSPFFLVIKILLGIYVAILFIDFVLLIIQRNFISNVREGFTIGMNIPPELTIRKEKLKKKWLKIKEKLKSSNEDEYKVAIIEADDLIGDLVKRLGFKGENFGDTLDNIPSGQLDNVFELQEAHRMRNKIVHEEKLQLSREDAQKTLELYETFLDYFEVLN